MSVITFLREEIVCFLVLLFIVISSFLHTSRTNEKRYFPIYFSAMGYVIFDAATVYTVNHMGKVPDIINHSCHILLFLFAAYFSIEIMRYVVGIIFPEMREAKLKILVGWGYLVFTLLYLLVFFGIPIEYYKGENTYYSGGPAVLFGFAIPAVFFLAAVIMLWVQRKKISKEVSRPLFVMYGVLFGTLLLNAIFHELLLTGGGITLASLGVYASLEYNEYATKLRKVAELDYLTGIYNRGAGKKKMKQAIKRNVPGVFCLLDVDDFKQINDRFGQATGDYVLKNIAEVMRRHFHKEDVVVRVGGDEFAIYLTNIVSVSSAQAKLQEFMREVEQISIHQKQTCRTSVSIGGILIQDEQQNLEELFRMAEDLLCEAKCDRKGKCRIVTKDKSTI